MAKPKQTRKVFQERVAQRDLLYAGAWTYEDEKMYQQAMGVAWDKWYADACAAFKAHREARNAK